MAESPAHKFGQIIGKLLEDIMLPRLQEFCAGRGFYLDFQGERIGARNGKKVTWDDRYGNSHDLDFVIEKGGSASVRGRPVAFIEAAWRRYTKHSRNKAQEIQGAILPISEKYAWDRPFLGVVLAGEFTKGSLDQLDSIGFKVLYFPYTSIVDAFASVGIDTSFDESTPTVEFEKCIGKIRALSEPQWDSLKSHLIDNQRQLYDAFISELQESLDRSVESVIVIPLFGNEHGFDSLSEALAFLNKFEEKEGVGEFIRYEVRIKYTNGDNIDASFKSKKDMRKFIEYVGS